MAWSFTIGALSFGEGDDVVILKFLAVLFMLIGGSALLCLLCKLCEFRNHGNTVPPDVSLLESQPAKKPDHIVTPSKEKRDQRRDLTDNARFPLLMSDSLQTWMVGTDRSAAPLSNRFRGYELIPEEQHRGLHLVHVHRNVDTPMYVPVPRSLAEV